MFRSVRLPILVIRNFFSPCKSLLKKETGSPFFVRKTTKDYRSIVFPAGIAVLCLLRNQTVEKTRVPESHAVDFGLTVFLL